MLNFTSDYIEGAHPKLLQRLLDTNMVTQVGYGYDDYCQSAKEKIKAACQCPDAEIFFLVGGTQTNMTVIDAMLGLYEGVIACETGHVNVHEAGAIESTCHKVLALPSHDGKLKAADLEAYLYDFYHFQDAAHMVNPGMVYISFPTEQGSIYSKEEMTQLSKVCREYELPLYVDGARLGYGLMSKECDLTLPELAELADVFYIGGTKVGALCGEAVVFTKKNAPKGFFTIVKQHGALLAKGRLLGLQFDELFTDDLYFEISKHAIEMAELVKQIVTEKGYEMAWHSPTNQQFVKMKDSDLERIKDQVKYEYWEKCGPEHSVVRFATSWATTEENVRKLAEIL